MWYIIDTDSPLLQKIEIERGEYNKAIHKDNNIIKMSSTTSTSISKEQKYLLNSKTFMENIGELTELCWGRSKGDKKFARMLVRKYTSLITDWLKENWECAQDDIKEEILKFVFELVRRNNEVWNLSGK